MFEHSNGVSLDEWCSSIPSVDGLALRLRTPFLSTVDGETFPPRDLWEMPHETLSSLLVSALFRSILRRLTVLTERMATRSLYAGTGIARVGAGTACHGRASLDHARSSPSPSSLEGEGWSLPLHACPAKAGGRG